MRLKSTPTHLFHWRVPWPSLGLCVNDCWPCFHWGVQCPVNTTRKCLPASLLPICSILPRYLQRIAMCVVL